jgi:hypothetical protein
MVRTLVTLTLCLSLASLLFGQERTAPLSPGGPPIQPGTTITPTQSYVPSSTIPFPAGALPLTPNVPVPATGTVPPPATYIPPPPSGSAIPGVQFPRASPFALIPSSPGRTVEHHTMESYSVTIKADLDDGTTLSGTMLCDGTLPCMTVFGAAAIPVNKIRGIAWRDTEEHEATLLFENNDSLTVTVTTPTVQIKTAWGSADVEVAHLRGVILTAESYKWSPGPDGRRVLVPDFAEPGMETIERETRPKE